MAHMVFCVRYKKEMEGLEEPPFDSEFGQKIYKNVSQAAWGEWVDRQKMLLNEYRLQPWTPQAQKFLVEQMEQFFFGEGLGDARAVQASALIAPIPRFRQMVGSARFCSRRRAQNLRLVYTEKDPRAGSDRAG